MEDIVCERMASAMSQYQLASYRIVNESTSEILDKRWRLFTALHRRLKLIHIRLGRTINRKIYLLVFAGWPQSSILIWSMEHLFKRMGVCTLNSKTLLIGFRMLTLLIENSSGGWNNKMKRKSVGHGTTRASSPKRASPSSVRFEHNILLRVSIFWESQPIYSIFIR